jgi:TRAP-type C4-dicarboxylate transport system permease large subunit
MHYGIVVVLAMGIGLFASPFWVGYCAAYAFSWISSDEGIKPILEYIVALVIDLIVVAAMPWISIRFLD